jgi:hypothetical protein
MMRDALIYLAAAVLMVPLAKKLGLIAGVVIGPWGFRLVSDVESIMHFSEFGVVLMLFVIGLELEPKRLWSMKREVFGGGSLQLGICGAALTGGAMLFGLPWQAALVAGMALALSSTAIAVATMTERNFLRGICDFVISGYSRDSVARGYSIASSRCSGVAGPVLAERVKSRWRYCWCSGDRPLSHPACTAHYCLR